MASPTAVMVTMEMDRMVMWQTECMAMEKVKTSGLLIITKAAIYVSASLGSPGSLHFQLVPGLSRKRYDTVPITV